MILTTTSLLDGKTVTRYHGIVSAEVIVGANVFRDLFAGVRDFVGGRSGAYEKPLRSSRETAFRELEAEARDKGANAIIGIDVDYQVIGKSGSMLMVSVTGTAVTVSDA
ncbi:heavy metal-binding domain-containing protein [Sphingomonas sp.]|jgi:uncharacterized protein YbjQ (UPF0145 family)|uniref:heavy metal-binding domain-containing protein n=1 Tax=Sphingomonas sp. TaxID=28214 RepID=UPI003D6D4A12